MFNFLRKVNPFKKEQTKVMREALLTAECSLDLMLEYLESGKNKNQVKKVLLSCKEQCQQAREYKE